MTRLRLQYILALLANLLMLTPACAQRITVKAPGNVAVGQQFQLQYVVNTTDVKGFALGNVPDAFNVAYGPSTSTQQSFSMVNGRTSQSSSVTYTYVLIAQKNGSYVIPAAHATVAGSKVSSQAVRINVSGHASSGSSQHSSHGYQQSGPARVDRAGSRISGKDLFIRVTANKQRVYEQEPILLTYKVYTQVELTQLEGKMPDLNGFHTQEIPLPQQKTFHVETIGGKAYRCVTWSQYVMFPQMTGKLEIPSITFKGIVMQENPNVDPFEAFFNGGSGYIEVKKEIKAPSVNIQVTPLPQRPVNFSGGVGHFSISSSVDKKTVRAGDPISFRIVLSGAGNMKLIKMPELNLPKDFDRYDPKITDKTQLSTAGLTGNMIYDYVIVPRNKGSYTLPAMEFVYFDTQSAAYKTVRTQPISITVEQGNGQGGATDYSQRLDNDVSDLLTGEANYESPYNTFFGSATHIISTALILLIFIILLIVFRKRALLMADVGALRSRKANKVATARLRKAAKLQAEMKTAEFYEEVLRALWGFVGDKLNMPAEQLSRSNIRERLSEKGTPDEVTEKFIEAIDECEYARYAPSGDASDTKEKMLNTYNKAKDAITGSFTAVVLLLLSLSLNISAANTKADADAAYRTADYQKAISLYKTEMKKGMSAEIYHNIANCYYRVDSLPQAILFYQRALKVQPASKQIAHSLEIAHGKTVDRLPLEGDIFLTLWYKGLLSLMTADNWAYLSLVSLALSLILLLVYLFAGGRIVSRLSPILFPLVFVLLALFIVFNIFAYGRHNQLATHTEAVVMAPAATVKTAPEEKATEACVIHEGTTVRITDRDIKGWYAIRLSDGREGWLQTDKVEEI